LATVLTCPVRWRPELFALRAAAERIVGRALLGVLQRLVRLGDFLELLFRAGFFRDVGMIFLRKPSIGLADFVGGSAALDTERGVVIRVLHRTLSFCYSGPMGICFCL
jgi:hypothetical protein